MNKQIHLLLSACILLMLTTACFKLQRAEFPDKQYFMMEIRRLQPPVSETAAINLRIQRLRVAPGFDGKNFVYRTGPMTYETDYYNQFFIAPADMLTQNVREWFRSSGLFHVSDGSGIINTPYILQGEVVSLYGDYGDKGRPPQAVLEMAFQIIDTSPEGSGIIFQKKYRQAIDLNGGKPHDLVAGWNECLAQILSAFENDVALAWPQKDATSP